MRYSFDPAKQASNLKKHGLSLADARQVIESIVTAETKDHIRIISMRKADRHEQAIYRENLS
ncbi:MAG TPA: BrnT family toxin [Burkholderiaceae bacterium]|nr:BrnT family toxin [Burkholderiaceae bacterium]